MPFSPAAVAKAASVSSSEPVLGGQCSVTGISEDRVLSTEHRPLSTGSESFPKRERIAKRADFVRIYDEGRKIFGKYAIIFAAGNECGHPRIGITVTRKAGKAHDRNRLKRWVREIYRRQRQLVGLDGQSVDLVVNVKTNAPAATFDEFSKDLERSFRRVAATS